MTPTTTPAPMTHEGDDVFIPKPCCIRADGACFEEGECLSDCEALDRDLLRGASERELRQRLERAERDRSEWRTRADALAARLETAEAKWSEAEQACAFATGAAKANHENAVSEAKAHGETLQKMQQLAAHIAELEAGIGRLADDWHPRAQWFADELRALLRGEGREP